MTTDYARLSLSDIQAEFDAIAQSAGSMFGHLDDRQLNWRPDPGSWSVGQCLDHLLTANREMFQAMDRALDDRRPRTVWQRLPLVPSLLGRLLIRSQTPSGTRKFKAPAKAAPAGSVLDRGIVTRFVDGQRDAKVRLQAVAGRDPARTIMVSPFAAFIPYNVLDGWRLLVAHEHRHLAQARRVIATSGFPR